MAFRALLYQRSRAAILIRSRGVHDVANNCHSLETRCRNHDVLREQPRIENAKQYQQQRIRDVSDYRQRIIDSSDYFYLFRIQVSSLQ